MKRDRPRRPARRGAERGTRGAHFDGLVLAAPIVPRPNRSTTSGGPPARRTSSIVVDESGRGWSYDRGHHRGDRRRDLRRDRSPGGALRRWPTVDRLAKATSRWTISRLSPRPPVDSDASTRWAGSCSPSSGGSRSAGTRIPGRRALRSASSPSTRTGSRRSGSQRPHEKPPTEHPSTEYPPTRIPRPSRVPPVFSCTAFEALVTMPGSQQPVVGNTGSGVVARAFPVVERREMKPATRGRLQSCSGTAVRDACPPKRSRPAGDGPASRFWGGGAAMRYVAEGIMRRRPQSRLISVRASRRNCFGSGRSIWQPP